MSNLKNINYGTINAENVRIGDNYITYNNYFAAQEVKIPHHLTNNIPTNADHILGRATELQVISKHLTQNKPTVLVNGIGGIGKTSVATKYVATHGHTYKHLAWLTVQSSVAEVFTNDIVLLESLHIEQHVRQLIETQRLTDAFKLVIKKLNDLENTLVVLDNANDLADLVEYKNLFDTAKCHYLITSRTQPQEWSIVEIDHLPEDEAVALFRKIAPSVSATDEALKSLLSKLFYHTLLIELVAKAVENAGFSFAELQTMIETKFIHDENLNEDIVSTGQHGDSVATNRKRAKIEEYIWLIFSNVKDLGENAKQILRGMALLPVATPFDRDFLKTHLALFEVKEIVPNLSLLVEWGWLHKDGKGFKMHPLIGDVVVEHLDVDINFSSKYIWYVGFLIDYDKNDPNSNLFKNSKNKWLAIRLVDLFFYENDDKIAYLISRLGALEQVLGIYHIAAKNKIRALNIVENIFPENYALIADFQNSLALVFQDLGVFNLAVEIFEVVLAYYTKNLGSHHPTTCSVQSNLAMSLHSLGKNEEAVDLLEIVLENDFRNYEEGHSTIAITQSNLGWIYQSIGKNERAAELLELALASDLKNFNENHQHVAICQSNLGMAYLNLGKYEKALELLETALKNTIKSLGNWHPTVAVLQSNLALVYQHLEKYIVAIELLEEALRSDIKNLGYQHPHVAIRQFNLANIFFLVHRQKEAMSLWKQAYYNSLNNLGEEHYQTIVLKELVDAEKHEEIWQKPEFIEQLKKSLYSQ